MVVARSNCSRIKVVTTTLASQSVQYPFTAASDWHFYCATHYMHSAVLAVERWQDGWMSHAGIVSKRRKISSNFFSVL